MPDTRQIETSSSAGDNHLNANNDLRRLKVIVVGAGIGGLAAAIALRQRGHHVEMYEQSRFHNEIGAAIHITPNAMGALSHIGIDPRDFGAVPLIQVQSAPKFQHCNNNEGADQIYFCKQHGLTNYRQRQRCCTLAECGFSYAHRPSY